MASNVPCGDEVNVSVAGSETELALHILSLYLLKLSDPIENDDNGIVLTLENQLS